MPNDKLEILINVKGMESVREQIAELQKERDDLMADNVTMKNYLDKIIRIDSTAHEIWQYRHSHIHLAYVRKHQKFVFWSVMERPGCRRKTRACFEKAFDAVIYGYRLTERFARIYNCDKKNASALVIV